MTQEQKARAYDEALKRAKAAIDIAADKDLVKGVVTTIFPSLRESEDERMMTWLITQLKTNYKGNYWAGKAIDYLEKQKESLHISETCKENANSFTDARKDVIVAIEIYLDWLTGYPDYAPKGKYSIRDMLHCLFILEKQKEQKPVFNEDDERLMELAIHSCEMCGNPFTASWLKSIRPSWKPSEEQMEALEKASTNKYLSAEQYDILVSLYEQLKKLI